LELLINKKRLATDIMIVGKKSIGANDIADIRPIKNAKNSLFFKILTLVNNWD
jgi:hypothetical protein